MKILKYVNGYLYHIYNRGVDGRNIFEKPKDYQRFIHSLYEFNDQQFALPYSQTVEGREILDKKRPRQLLVNILCFCLMPNHFHLILQQIVAGGITKFMRKLGTGYTMFFNIKYERSGVLFQGKFKSILIDMDKYMLHLSRYIHLNPIELIQPNWKQEGIKDYNKVEYFLKGYRWSSLLDYLGIRNLPYVMKGDFIKEYFKGPKDYRKFVLSWLVEEQEKIRGIVLE